MFHSTGFEPLPRASAVGHGLPQVALEGFYNALGQLDVRWRGVMILQGGSVIAERWWPPYQPDDRVWVYSISKSYTSTAVGLAVDDGLLALDDRVVDFFPGQCPADISDNLAAMRLRHLLAMTCGHDTDSLALMKDTPDGDWVRAFLALPVPHAPGSFFRYNSGASFMAAAMVEKATGQKLVDYLAPRLFGPLGFDSVEWAESPTGIAAGGWGIVVRLEDLAKLGRLYLDGGIWEGRRILSEEWVRQATAKQADNSQNPDNQAPDWLQGYGFQFWRCRHGAFRADGAAGQYCVVLPRHNAVVAIMSESLEMQPTLDAIWEHLLPHFGTVASPAEAQVNGAVYTLDENPLGLETAKLAFDSGTLTLALEGAGESCILPAGRGEWLESESPLPFGHKALLPTTTLSGGLRKMSAHFAWPAADTLEISWVWRQTPHADKLLCRFAGQSIELECPANAAALFSGGTAVVLRGRTSAPVNIAPAAQLAPQPEPPDETRPDAPVSGDALQPGPAPGPKYTRQSTVGQLLKDKKVMVVLEQHMPGVAKNPAVTLVKRFTLERLAGMPQLGLTDEALDALLAAINAAVG